MGVAWVGPPESGHDLWTPPEGGCDNCVGGCGWQRPRDGLKMLASMKALAHGCIAKVFFVGSHHTSHASQIGTGGCVHETTAPP